MHLMCKFAAGKFDGPVDGPKPRWVYKNFHILITEISYHFSVLNKVH